MIRVWVIKISLGISAIFILSGCASIPAQSEQINTDYGQEMSPEECVSIAKQFVAKRFFNPESAQFRQTKCAKNTWKSVPSKNLEEVFGWMQQGEVNAANRKGEYRGFRKYQALLKNKQVIRYCIYNSKGTCTPREPPDCTHEKDNSSTTPVKVVNNFLMKLENGDIKSAMNLYACPEVFRYTPNAYSLGELKSISNELITGKTKYQVLCGKSMSSVAVVIVNQNIKDGKSSGDPDPLFLVLENKSWRILRYRRIEKEEYAYFTPTQKKEYNTLFNWHRNNIRHMVFGGERSVCAHPV